MKRSGVATAVAGGAGAADEAVEVLRELLSRDDCEYEIYSQVDSGVSVEAQGGRVEALKARSGRGVGVRVIRDGRLGFSYSSMLDRDSLAALVAEASLGASAASKDENLSLPAPSALSGDEGSLGVYDPGYVVSGDEERIARAMRIEEAARAHDKRVTQVRKASYSESVSEVRIVNSRGVDATKRATYFSGSVTAIAAADGVSETGWEMQTSHSRSEIDPDFIGAGAARNAVRMLGAGTIKTVKCPAVMENTVVCELVEALAASFLGDNVVKGKSMLAGKLGSKVASGAVNLYDDGVMPGGWSTAPFDAEGVARQRTGLIARGVCSAFLYDGYWSRRASTASTGNAARGGYKTPPSVGFSNLYLDKGAGSLDDLLSSVGRGLLITELLGVHTINTVSGDFSLGAAGLMVEGGRAVRPVRSMAIAGNLLDLFTRVESVGADLRFMGSVGAPSIMVGELEASGS